MRSGRGAAWAIACLLVTLGTPALPRIAEPPAVSPRPYLWRVERHGRTSHLFGTIHVGVDPEAALGPAGRQALDGARRVFVEMDLTCHDTVSEFTMGAMRRAEMPPSHSLRTLLRADAWRRLASLHEGSLTTAELERLEPWFVSQWTLPQVLAPRAKALPGVRRGTPPLDAWISLHADAQGTKVLPLESPVEHLGTFTAVGRMQSVAVLEETVSNPEAMRRETDRLVAAYASADDRTLRKLVGRLARRRPTVAEYVLFRRNERWRDKLELWLPEGRIFVAVGVGHMYGERGLVSLLRQRGYRVERVPPAELAG